MFRSNFPFFGGGFYPPGNDFPYALIDYVELSAFLLCDLRLSDIPALYRHGCD